MPVSRSSSTITSKCARLIPALDQQKLIDHVCAERHPNRNEVTALLSSASGHRAGEIAELGWLMVSEVSGRLSASIDVGRHIAKKGNGRRIPSHSEVRAAIKVLHAEQRRLKRGAVRRSERGGHMSAKSFANRFAAQFPEFEFHGCSSHSGRRTMITITARSLAEVGGSLRDVQELAGRRSLATTEGYIQGDRAIQRRLSGLV
nr:site-specific integrase [Sphingomonas sp. IC-11]